MKKIVGVRFRHTGKSYYYDANDLDLSVGSGVIVKSEDGSEYGTVSVPPIEKEDEDLPAILKQIVRKANQEDEERIAENKEMEKEAYKVGKEKIAELELPMKLIQAEYTFDRNKLLFYFSAEGRVDFRELVRVLASVFKTRIELRQIGVRDEAKMLGGIGICGRPLCCSTYLSDFAPVSIKMAKEQNLSLNPTKISGLCGRLMCCLGHEEETYEYLNKTMPRNGDFAVNIEGVVGVIRSVNILKRTVLVMFEDGDTREMKEYSVDEIGVAPRREGVPSDAKIAVYVEGLKSRIDDSDKTYTAPARKSVPDKKQIQEKKDNSPEEIKPDSESKDNSEAEKKEKKQFEKDKRPQKKNDSDRNRQRNNRNKDNKRDNKKNNNSNNNNNNNNNKPQKSRNFKGKQNNKPKTDKQRDNKKDNNDKKNRPNNQKDNKFKKNKGGNNQNKQAAGDAKQNTKARRNGGYNRGYRGDRDQ